MIVRKLLILKETFLISETSNSHLMLAERKGGGDDCGDQLLLVIFALALEHFHVKVSTVFCTIVHLAGSTYDYEHEYKGAFYFSLLCKLQSCAVKWNLSLSVNNHKSIIIYCQEIGSQERAALDTE